MIGLYFIHSTWKVPCKRLNLSQERGKYTAMPKRCVQGNRMIKIGFNPSIITEFPMLHRKTVITVQDKPVFITAFP